MVDLQKEICSILENATNDEVGIALSNIVLESPLLPLLASYIRNDSILEIEKSGEFYESIATICSIFATFPEIVSVLVEPINPKYPSTTIHSLYQKLSLTIKEHQTRERMDSC